MTSTPRPCQDRRQRRSHHRLPRLLRFRDLQPEHAGPFELGRPLLREAQPALPGPELAACRELALTINEGSRRREHVGYCQRCVAPRRSGLGALVPGRTIGDQLAAGRRALAVPARAGRRSRRARARSRQAASSAATTTGAIADLSASRAVAASIAAAGLRLADRGPSRRGEGDGERGGARAWPARALARLPGNGRQQRAVRGSLRHRGGGHPRFRGARTRGARPRRSGSRQPGRPRRP